MNIYIAPLYSDPVFLLSCTPLLTNEMLLSLIINFTGWSILESGTSCKRTPIKNCLIILPLIMLLTAPDCSTLIPIVESASIKFDPPTMVLLVIIAFLERDPIPERWLDKKILSLICIKSVPP